MGTHPTAATASSDALKTNIANFMSRADDVLRHPLAGSGASGITLLVTYDPSTGTVLDFDLDSNNIAEEALLYLGTKMRPIIFTESDPISLLKLISVIEYEHPTFRGKFKPLRDEYNTWRRRLLIGAAEWTDPSSPPDHRSLTIMTAPAGTTEFPDGTSVDSLVSDMYYANLYFNSEAWHSDTDKAAEYQAASESMKRHIRKCAELRTLGAIFFIRSLHVWVTEVRRLGLDI